MSHPTRDRAVFHHRDSGGRAEMTPGQYVEWAQRKAQELNLSFDGTPQRIEAMIREGRSVDGDLFVDYDVKGSQLSRTGLNALIHESVNDPRVAAVLIPRRDRLARPDDPLDGIKLENAFQFAGKAVVYMDRTLPPLKKGKKADIAQLITALVDFDRAEKDRRDLAQKILYAQLRLAKLGFSTGGRPPYGFRRWLVKDDGTQVRQLAAGERVRMAGHHVVWLPTAESELKVIRRILAMLETMPASQVAARLTAEGVPSPDAGRWRKDRGVKHAVSGVWHQTTVIHIARNSLLVAVTTFGLRSMGDKFRCSPEGPRELEDADFREDAKPKIIRNPESQRITAPARFEPLVDVDRHQRLLATLDARGGVQRGKPRAHDPAKNPLGGRIFDLGCSWPMYRTPYGKTTFRYKCGYYLQSHGAKCSHNTVDGPTATRFMLSCLRQRLLSPTLLPNVERRLRELAAQVTDQNQGDHQLGGLQSELAQVQSQLRTVSGNMALAKTPEQFEAISGTFDQLKAHEENLQGRIREAEPKTAAADIEAEIAVATDVIHRLADLVAAGSGLDLAAEAFRLTNARLFLRFQPVQTEKRLLNKLAGGVVVFGAAPNPIEVYRGQTGRRALNHSGPTSLTAAETGTLCVPPENTTNSGVEGNSLRNVNRGDWIRTSDLLVPNQALYQAEPRPDRK